MFQGRSFDEDVDGAFLKEIMEYEEKDLKAFADSVRKTNPKTRRPRNATTPTVHGMSQEELKELYSKNKAILKELQVKKIRIV